MPRDEFFTPPQKEFVESLFRSTLMTHRRFMGSEEWHPPSVVNILSVQHVQCEPGRMNLHMGTFSSLVEVQTHSEHCDLNRIVSKVTGSLTDAGSARGVLLWHGCPPDRVDSIIKSGFDLAKADIGSAFGQGIYLAQHASKSDVYAKPDRLGVQSMFLVCAALGDMYPAKGYMPHLCSAPCRKCEDSCLCSGLAHFGSVYGVTREHGGVLDYPEHVIYNPNQALPLVIVRYCHDVSCACAVCFRLKD